MDLRPEKLCDERERERGGGNKGRKRMEKSTYNRMEEEARKRVRETRVWRGKSEKHVATSSPLLPLLSTLHRDSLDS